MQQYLDLIEKVLDQGEESLDRTGVGTVALFGEQLRFDLREGFPILTTKRVHFKSVVTELLWFLQADTNTSFLEKNNVTIWREWQDERGELGRIYQAKQLDWLPSPTKVVKVAPRIIPQPEPTPVKAAIENLDPSIEVKTSAYGYYYIVPNSQKSINISSKARQVVTI